MEREEGWGGVVTVGPVNNLGKICLQKINIFMIADHSIFSLPNNLLSSFPKYGTVGAMAVTLAQTLGQNIGMMWNKHRASAGK